MNTRQGLLDHASSADLEGIVNLTTKLKPDGIGWESWRQSDNVEDHRPETLEKINSFLTSGKEGFDKYVSEVGPGVAYNMAIRALNKENGYKEVSEDVLKRINEELLPAMRKGVYEPEEWTTYKAQLDRPKVSVPMPRPRPK